MNRNKTMIRRAIPWLIILAALAALIIFVYVPIFSQKDEDSSRQPEILHYEGNYAEHIIMQNEDLIFDMDPETTQFEVTEIKSGRIWKSNPISPELFEDEELKNQRKDTDRTEQLATLNVGYYEVNGANELEWNNYNMSIKNRLFEIQTVEREDGSVGTIRVRYTLGDVEREYIVPNIVTKERMDEIKKKVETEEYFNAVYEEEYETAYQKAYKKEYKKAYDKALKELKDEKKAEEAANKTVAETAEKDANKKAKDKVNKDKKKISSMYGMISPDDFKSKTDEEKQNLKRLYDGIGESTFYVISDKAGSDNKESVEKVLHRAGYSQEEYEQDKERMLDVKEVFRGHLYNITVVYRLEGNNMIVEIPYDEINFQASHPMNTISILPYFGYAGPEDEGFMFVPEGGGAIIRNNNGKTNFTAAYKADIYGWDYARQRTKDVSSESRLDFAVFGVSQRGGSFICIPEGAVSYLQVNADIAGKTNNFYNIVYGKYYAMHADKFSVSTRTNNEVNIFEAEMPHDTIIQRYRFVDSDKYTDMALAYREYLQNHYQEELKEAKASEDVPVNVEIIGAINKKVIKMGIPVDSVVATTTFAQAADILSDLSDSRVKQLSIRISGWCNGGVRQEVLTDVHVLNELGGEKGMQQLRDQAAEKGVDLYFDGMSCFAYHSGISNGFLPYNNAAKYATREQVHLYPVSIATFRKAEMQDDYYLVKPQYAKDNASNLIRKLSEMKVTGVAFRDIGYLLSADYNPKDLVTREQVKQMNIATMNEAIDAGRKVMIREGNDYAMIYADLITDMNLTGQHQMKIDQQIPFYQIAIHGMKDYTGQSINLSGDYETKLLECAEYGAGLNLTFMSEDNSILQDSDYSAYMATEYSRWKKSGIIDTILEYQKAMTGLNQQQIIDHEFITDEVHVTTYEDGTKVYVNYSNSRYEDLDLDARSYKVKRGDGQ